jgi:hypothetical protein
MYGGIPWIRKHNILELWIPKIAFFLHCMEESHGFENIKSQERRFVISFNYYK